MTSRLPLALLVLTPWLLTHCSDSGGGSGPEEPSPGYFGGGAGAAGASSGGGKGGSAGKAGGSAAGGPGSCEGTFSEPSPCADCYEESCCEPLQACLDDAACSECLEQGTACPGSAAAAALGSCASAACAGACKPGPAGCQGIFEDPGACESCAEGSCCDALAGCVGDADCKACLQQGDASRCKGAAYQGLQQCLGTRCDTACGAGGSAGAGGAASCDGIFKDPDDCGNCLEDKCCGPIQGCLDDANCLACLQGDESKCTGGAFSAYQQCGTTACKAACTTTPATCEGTFSNPGPCETCVEGKCCAQTQACLDDAACLACLQGDESKCKGSAYASFQQCLSASCAAQCAPAPEPVACQSCDKGEACPAGTACGQRYCDGRKGCYGTGDGAVCTTIGGAACPAVTMYGKCTSDADCGVPGDYSYRCDSGVCRGFCAGGQVADLTYVSCPELPPGQGQGVKVECASVESLHPCANPPCEVSSVYVAYCALACTASSTCPYGTTCQKGYCR